MLTARTSDYESATVVHVSGDIDRDVAAEFRRVLMEAAQRRRRELIVDMSAVSFLDSAGLAVLVGVRRSLEVDQRLALAAVPTRMQRVLHDTAMSTLMTVHGEGDPWPWSSIPEPSVRGGA